MRISTLFLMAGFGLALTACKTDSDQAQATPAAKPVKTASAGLICHTDADTGTRIPIKECHTQAQWNDIAAQGQDSLTSRAARTDQSTGNTRPSGS